MIRGDSSDYELLNKWTKGFDCQGYKSCEIGVREGLGSKIIMDNVVNNYIHVGVDPYGNLKYQHYDNTGEYTCDYTDEMRDTMLNDFYQYRNNGKFALCNMTDTLIETILKKYDFNNIEQGKNKILLEKK
jgi:hypothetical protein